MTRCAVLIFGLALLAGCSPQQLLRQGQSWQQTECRRLADLAEQQRCLRSSAAGFEAYQAEAAKARKP
ncbi:MAG: hypothetical protein Q8N44_10770 [Rubrivivax sp.]|nr:hypothetical protein [Rubrivivax sp.]